MPPLPGSFQSCCGRDEDMLGRHMSKRETHGECIRVNGCSGRWLITVEKFRLALYGVERANFD